MVQKNSYDLRLIELYKRHHFIALLAVILVILSYRGSNDFFSCIDELFLTGLALLIFVNWLQYWMKMNYPDVVYDYKSDIHMKYLMN